MDEPDWYADWRHQALHDLIAKQDRNLADFQTGTWERFDYDLDTLTLSFSDRGVTKVIADIQVVGTTGPEDWLWAWANTDLPEGCRRDVEQVKAFGEEHGIAELTFELLGADDLNSLGWSLAAVAARICDAQGAYRAPSLNGALFLIFRNIRYVS
ncbi:MAG TPA: hypothetical protein VIO94_07350 [Phenylobacterium sp.]